MGSDLADSLPQSTYRQLWVHLTWGRAMPIDDDRRAARLLCQFSGSLPRGRVSRSCSMSDREIDQPGRARATRRQSGIDLLLSSITQDFRLLSRLIRDSAEIEDVAQDAFVKAYRALPNFAVIALSIRGCTGSPSIPPRTIWYRRAGARRLPHRQSRRSETFDDGDHLRDLNTPDSMLVTKQWARRLTGDRQLPEIYARRSFA